MKTPLISIQILNWNRAVETQRAIQSALDQSYPNIEIVVIDNGSTDNSVSLTRENYPQIKIVELDKNYGCPGGRNQGIDYCKGEYIFYLDNDGVLHQDAVKNAYETILKYPDVGIVTGILYDFETPSEIDAKCEIRSRTKYIQAEFQGGICMHDKKIYLKTGKYPDHFMYGFEETFLSMNAMENNIRIIKDESVVLWHKKSAVARNKAVELKNAYFNRLYAAVSLYPVLYAIRYAIFFIPVYINYARKAGFLKFYLKNYVSTYFKNMRLGLKHRTPVSVETYRKFTRFKKFPVD